MAKYFFSFSFFFTFYSLCQPETFSFFCQGFFASFGKKYSTQDSIPANIPDVFAQASSNGTENIQLAYPLDNVLLPKNLGTLEFQWNDPSLDGIFEIEIYNEFISIKKYLNATSGSNTWIELNGEAEWYTEKFNHSNKEYYWLVFVSKRNYGVKSANQYKSQFFNSQSLFFCKQNI